MVAIESRNTIAIPVFFKGQCNSHFICGSPIFLNQSDLLFLYMYHIETFQTLPL